MGTGQILTGDSGNANTSGLEVRVTMTPAEVTRKIGSSEIEQRLGFLQLFRPDAGEHEIAQGAGVALGGDHLAKSGGTRRGGRVFPDRE